MFSNYLELIWENHMSEIDMGEFKLTNIAPVGIIIRCPLFHPALFQNIIPGLVCGTSVEDCHKQFIDLDYACLNPANIDAAVYYKRNKDEFDKINDNIRTTILKGFCPTCSLRLKISYASICYRGHVLCGECLNSHNDCILCHQMSSLSTKKG